MIRDLPLLLRNSKESRVPASQLLDRSIAGKEAGRLELERPQIGREHRDTQGLCKERRKVFHRHEELTSRPAP